MKLFALGEDGSVKLSLLSAYKGLKPEEGMAALHRKRSRLLSAYKGLKLPINITRSKIYSSLLSAYKGLKLSSRKNKRNDNKSLLSAYKGLKLHKIYQGGV